MEVHIPPPSPRATVEEWQQWLAANDRAERSARAVRAAESRKLPMGELPPMATVKVGGRWVQASPVGFSGPDGAASWDPIATTTPADVKAGLTRGPRRSRR